MRYIGNKTSLLKNIEEVILELITNDTKVDTFIDVFSGTGCVGEFFKDRFKIVAGELLYSSYLVCKARIDNNEIEFKRLGEKGLKSVGEVVEYLNNLEKKENGYCFNEYSENGSGKRLFFSEENGKKIDSIVDKIYEWKEEKLLNESEFAYLMYILMEAIHSVSNTTGVYGAYLKKLNGNAIKPIKLEKIDIKRFNRENIVINGDSCETLLTYMKSNTIVYLDPPYNERQYGSNYHVVETIAKNDKPKIKKIGERISVSGLREDLPVSKWCKKDTIKNELEKILNTEAKYFVMSYNSESLISKEEIIELMSKYGETKCIENVYKKYKSEKDNFNKTEVIEYLFVLNKNKIILNEVENVVENEVINDISEEKSDTKSECLPIVQWVGGKRRILDKIKPYIKYDSSKTYFEPFLGGGALLFDILPEKAVCVEKNEGLFNVYKQVRDNSEKLIELLEKFHSEYNGIVEIKGDNSRSNYYYEKRSEYNKLKEKEDKTNEEEISAAGLFIFLNRTGFNGMYRENKKGHNTIPFGNGKDCNLMLEDNIRNMSKYLNKEGIKILNGDFEEIKELVKEGDIVYMDPPYHGTFVGYDKGGFNEEDSIRVIELFKYLVGKGVNVVLSNNNSEEYRKIFSSLVINDSYEFKEISIARTINSKKENRKASKCELLVVSKPKLPIKKNIKVKLDKKS
jgi:adenine-specific DNA-methyltransferase